MDTEIAKTEKQYEKQVAEFHPNAAFANALIPKTFKEAMELAVVLSKSGVVPTGMVGRPEACFVAIGFGMELGLPPMQAIQNIMVVNGRPTIWGDAAHALVMGSGQVEMFEEDAPDIALTQGFGRCRIKLRGMPEIERRFSIEDAKRAKLWTKEGPWQTYPGRMLQMRTRSWAERDAAPFILKGIQFREEIGDMDIVSPPVRMPEARRRTETVQDAMVVGGGHNPPPTEPRNAQPAPQAATERGSEKEQATNDAIEPGNSPTDDLNDLKVMKISPERRQSLFAIRAAAKVSLVSAKEWLAKINLQDTSELTNGEADEFEAWIASQSKA